ncbi:hypothetical protein [Pararhizobium sp.]|uniref:hypothetical protein n=1 Tax=Pararhizobium sp. TaxID=1977563 RepID=UPI002716213B|nr:hypothetical protein [Pararhizobium sp.]MDO9418744.1 hypothetical protein [Pararhizobium sp.]
MLKFLSNAGLAVVLTASTFTTMAPPAFSQDLELRLGDDVIIGRPRKDRDRPRFNDDEDMGQRRPRRGCDPDDALDLARDAGFRRARIAGVTPRRVIVQGMTRGGPDRITFANVRGCPEL